MLFSRNNFDQVRKTCQKIKFFFSCVVSSIATVTIFFPFLCWRNIIARHVALAAERGFALVRDGPPWIISSLCEEGQDHMARDRLTTYFPHPPRSFGIVRPRNLFNRHQARRTGLFLSGAPRGGR